MVAGVALGLEEFGGQGLLLGPSGRGVAEY